MKKHIKLLLALGAAIFFFAGFFISAFKMVRPLEVSQCEYYEQVAQEVFERSNNFFVECPEDVVVEMTATTIKVSSSRGYLGYVNAKLKDGELKFERVKETSEFIYYSLMMGFSMIAVPALLGGLIYSISKSCNKRKKEQ